MADINKITLPNGDAYTFEDKNGRQKTADLIAVSDVAPSSPDNKLWIKTSGSRGVLVPTVEEALALGIEGASVGQIPKIASVGNSGEPTTWTVTNYNPDAKTSDMVKPIGVDANGKLWTEISDPATIASATEDWLDENIAQETGYVIDNSLTISGAAADAKKVGDEVDDLKSTIDNNVLRVLPSKNLYNPALNESGRMYLVNPGSKQTTTTSPTQVFQKMEVAVGEAYALSGISRGSLTDENDIVVENLTATDTNCIIQSVPVGVKYLWIETNATIASTVTQVEKGTEVTSYEAYGVSSDVGYGDTVIFEKNDVTNLKNDVSSLQEDVTDISGDIEDIQDDIEELKDATDVSGLFKTITGFAGQTTYDGHIDDNGDFTDQGSGWIRTGYIETAPGARLVSTLLGYMALPLVAFYDESKTYMGSVSVLSDLQRVVNTDMRVPNGVKYVAFSCATSYSDRSFSVEVPANLAEVIEVLSDDLYTYNGVNVVCIGDSLTRGIDGNNHVLPSGGYPHYMQEARLKKCNITNLGIGGSTTKSYWDDHKSDITVDPTTDVILCMWGTNGQLMRNTLATDVEPYDDYEDYADTGVGCYCKIIEYMMELTENNAQIILLTPPYNGISSINDRVYAAQSVVKAIAERYMLPVIDMFKCGIGPFNYSRYMPIDSAHFSEEGYEWIGKYIGGCVDAICSKIK